MSYNKVLLKVSGEVFLGQQTTNIDPDRVAFFVEELRQAATLPVAIAVVVGGGNIYRGRQAQALKIPRVQGDYMGMLATVINGLALHSALAQQGMPVRVMSSLVMPQVCELYTPAKAKQYWDTGHIVIIVGGLGQSCFTTDSAASLRAVEMGADVLIKGTKVAGIYTADPVKDPSAEQLKEVTFQEAYERRLGVMDMTAFTICEENRLPIIVYNANEPGHLCRIIQGERLGTLVR